MSLGKYILLFIFIFVRLQSAIQVSFKWSSINKWRVLLKSVFWITICFNVALISISMVETRFWITSEEEVIMHCWNKGRHLCWYCYNPQFCLIFASTCHCSFRSGKLWLCKTWVRRMLLKFWSDTERNRLHTWFRCRLSLARWANHPAWLLQDTSFWHVRLRTGWRLLFLLPLSVLSLNSGYLRQSFFAISEGTMKIAYGSVHTFQSRV